MIDYAVDRNVIAKAGTWFSFGEERIGQGRENARMFLKEHKDVTKQIEAKLFPLIGLKPPDAGAAVTATGAEMKVADAARPEIPKAPPAPMRPPMPPGKPQSSVVGNGERKR